LLGILIGLLSMIAIGIAAGFVGGATGAPEWLVFPVALVLWFGLWFFWPFGRGFEPVTVDDLLRAGHAGKWKKNLPRSHRSRA
jgi:hypothetical protein